MSRAGDITRWPLGDAVLIVDDEEVVLRTCAALVEDAGGRCFQAESYDAAMEVLIQEQQIGVVVLDHGVSGDDTGEFIKTLRALRPGVILVGSSGSDCRGAFAAVDVNRFLPKPWTLRDFVLTVLRIGRCVTCGLPSPLRRPLPGEDATRWICAQCGARYRAVLDESLPTDIFSSVRPAD